MDGLFQFQVHGSCGCRNILYEFYTLLISCPSFSYPFSIKSVQKCPIRIIVPSSHRNLISIHGCTRGNVLFGLGSKRESSFSTFTVFKQMRTLHSMGSISYPQLMNLWPSVLYSPGPAVEPNLRSEKKRQQRNRKLLAKMTDSCIMLQVKNLMPFAIACQYPVMMIMFN